MPEHIFIEKRRRKRAASLFSTRNILGLIMLSLVVYGAFYFWVGNPNEDLCGDDCGQMHSLMAWVLGFALLFGAIIAAGAVVGTILALVRRNQRESNVFTHMDTEEDEKP